MSEHSSRHGSKSESTRLSYVNEEKPSNLRYERKRLLMEGYSSAGSSKDVYPTPDYDDLRSLYRQILS